MKEKNNIWRFISLFISLNFLIINLLIHYIKRKKNIYIFDIDNTICDTWKSLPRKKTKNFRYIRNEIKRISLLKIFTKMKEFILMVSSNNRNTIIFLSMRQIYLWNGTFKYLDKNKIINSLFQIFLVSSIDDKYLIISFCRKLTKSNIFYFDDLSYNHEYGEVKFYNNTIERIKKMDLKYFGYNELKKFQSSSFSSE